MCSHVIRYHGIGLGTSSYEGKATANTDGLFIK